ncbi:class I SAM-dependent methyltransferase [Vibrio mexicanus]|uniref:class I SAM-dependent methyltransferase n=1 Tax=Vibrio mexicanus TaxID=1004326 RepID=UPI00063C8260|nr:class I SAM-dependent methyltransferase [Vibrio mexicanus]
MNTTDQYYTENAQSFFDTTVNVDVQKLYDHFLPHVKPNGAILDAGCGSGRDSKHFQDLGYDVTAFDANELLTQLASEHLGFKVIHATFDSYQATPESFDGIWACASLLHVPTEELPSVLNKYGELLTPKGVFYCSFKYGDTDQIRNGRFFSDMNETKLQKMLAPLTLNICLTWISSDARPGRESEKWLNVLLNK